MADMGGRMVCLNSVIPMIPATGFKFMNIARNEQRVLHVLAQGGLIRHDDDEQGRIILVECFTRDGYLLSDCTLDVFSRLRRKRLIESRESGPYRISRRGRESVRSQADNR